MLCESNDLSGKPNKIMGSIEEFKRNLEGELGLPIYFQKEFMTTVEARGRMGKEINNAKKTTKEKQKCISLCSRIEMVQITGNMPIERAL